MQRIIIGGSGFLGQYLTKRWLAENIPVTIVGRDSARLKTLFPETVTCLSWDQFIHDSVTHLHQCPLLLNLAGTNIGDKRWSQSRKQDILESRTQITQQLAEICVHLGDKSPPLFNASAIGVYGLQDDVATGLPTPCDESDKTDGPAPDFLAEVGRAWEAETNIAKARGVRVVLLRFGVILGPDGGALQKMQLPFKLGLGGPIGSGRQPFSWVHIEDVANAIEFLLARSNIVGPVNIVAPGAVAQKTFAQALGKALHRPAILPMPSFMAKLAFGEMADELLLRGQHVIPKYLQSVGFEFDYPDIDTTLSNILQAEN